MKYRVGDKVKIRSWKSMENEFGNNFGDICLEDIVFVNPMKCYCGKNATISHADIDFFGTAVYRIEGAGGWSFTEQMFDLIRCGGGENGEV